MDGSLELTKEERKVLLKAYRSGGNTRVARRAHVVRLRANGWTWSRIQEALFCSSDFIAQTLRVREAGRVTTLVETNPTQSAIPVWL